ncbi:hypothetical protein PQX77_010198 [Marasmius sp. AFHP31]|nr:hypothetical protein PQX77_010198 [Marasmius sp. AFHP31]
MSTSSTTDHEHRARLQLLQRLLKSLPKDLPDRPQDSSLNFGLDPEDVKDEGYYFAANRNFELCFETWKKGPGWDGTLNILERGRRWEDFVATVRKVLKMEKNEGCKKLLVEKWVEKLITAAKQAGGKLPTRTYSKSDDEDEEIQPKLTTRYSTSTTKRQFVVLSSDSEIEIIQPPSKQLKPTKRTKAVVPLDDESSDTDIDVIDNSHPITQPSASSSKGAQTLSNPNPGPKKLEQKTLLNWGREGYRARRFTAEELAAQRMRIEEGRRVKAEEETIRQERAKEKRTVKKREQGRLCVAKHRALKKSREAAGKCQRSAGRKAKKMVLNGDQSKAGGLENMAEASRPKGSSWRQGRNGKRGGVVERRHSRINWYHPLLWARIAKVAPSVSFSATLIVRILQQQDSQLYSTLHKGTVQHWLSKSGRGWSKRTLMKVNNQSVVAASGKVGVLMPYPNLVKAIVERLSDMRKSGVTVSRALARSVMIAMIRKEQPQLLNGKFKCTEQFVGDFLASKMDWTVRSGTRAAAHIPENAPELMERTFFRLVHLVTFYDIPPALVINMDQTGILVLMTWKKTYHKKGERQVDIQGKDEKRAYTLCVASTADGDFLPFQQVWSGKTKKSTPSKEAPGFDEAISAGFDFTCSQSKANSHYSTLKTMREWMTNILKPYVECYTMEHNLPSDQKTILYIDCYPVHTGEEFRTYVFRDFPNIFLIFVPANCTGIGQPADVGLQRVLKHLIRQDNLNYLVDSHTRDLEQGLTPAQIKCTTSLPALRDASVQPCVNAYNFFQTTNGRSLALKAWENCKIQGGFDLSGACLTDRKSKAAYRSYLVQNPDFRKEIEDKIGPIPEPEHDETETEDDEETDELEIPPGDEDTSDVPLQHVIHDALGIRSITLTERSAFAVNPDQVETDGGVSRGAGDGLYEDIRLYRNEGGEWAIQDFVTAE